MLTWIVVGKVNGIAALVVEFVVDVDGIGAQLELSVGLVEKEGLVEVQLVERGPVARRRQLDLKLTFGGTARLASRGIRHLLQPPAGPLLLGWCRQVGR